MEPSSEPNCDSGRRRHHRSQTRKQHVPVADKKTDIMRDSMEKIKVVIDQRLLMQRTPLRSF